MGFAGSAGRAQALTDTVMEEAGLPQSKRETYAEPCPSSFPVWGCIIDDLWTLSQQPVGAKRDRSSEPEQW
eukprot:15908125-Heterocapsa_arctica.AAC.1